MGAASAIEVRTAPRKVILEAGTSTIPIGDMLKIKVTAFDYEIGRENAGAQKNSATSPGCAAYAISAKN